MSNGPFYLAYAMAQDQDQPAYYRAPLCENLLWFEAHLPVPNRFQRRMGRASTGIGVCWFRGNAAPHIGRMRDMCVILNEIGYPVTRHWTAEPGLPIYQDDFQIVALEHTRPTHECW